MPVVYGCPRTGVFRCAKYSFFGKPQSTNRRTRSTLPKKAVQSPAFFRKTDTTVPFRVLAVFNARGLWMPSNRSISLCEIQLFRQTAVNKSAHTVNLAEKGGSESGHIRISLCLSTIPPSFSVAVSTEKSTSLCTREAGDGSESGRYPPHYLTQHQKCRCGRIGTFHYPVFFLQVKITLPDRVTSTVSPCFSNSISSWSAALALYRFPSASAR